MQDNIENVDLLVKMRLCEPQYFYMVKQAYSKLNQMEYFTKRFNNFIIPTNSEVEITKYDKDVFVDIPALYIHGNQYYDAIINIMIDTSNGMNGDVQICGNCTGEILLDMPPNGVGAEIAKFRHSKRGYYKVPKGCELIDSKYLGKIFFAFSKDYVLYSRYSPTSVDDNIFLSEYVTSYSAKAYKNLLFQHESYMINKGAMQVFNEEMHYNIAGEAVERKLCRDIIYPHIRELRQYKITPLNSGSIIQRSEFGLDTARHRCVPMTTLTKHVDTPFDKLGNMNNLAMLFEKQCRIKDRSKLIFLQQDRDEERQHKVIERTPQFVQRKKRLAPYDPKDTYKDYKDMKADNHDDSVKYAKSHHIQQKQAEQELEEPQGVFYFW